MKNELYFLLQLVFHHEDINKSQLIEKKLCEFKLLASYLNDVDNKYIHFSVYELKNTNEYISFSVLIFIPKSIRANI